MATWTNIVKNSASWTNNIVNSLQSFLLLETGDLLLSEDDNILLLEATGTLDNQSKNSASWTNQTKN